MAIKHFLSGFDIQHATERTGAKQRRVLQFAGLTVWCWFCVQRTVYSVSTCRKPLVIGWRYSGFLVCSGSLRIDEQPQIVHAHFEVRIRVVLLPN